MENRLHFVTAPGKTIWLQWVSSSKDEPIRSAIRLHTLLLREMDDVACVRNRRLRCRQNV